MSEKILFFLAGAFYHFGIAKFLQNKEDFEFYSIIDVDDKPRKFFETQKLVNFEKKWFYRDHVILDENRRPDLEYLAGFEEKYKINLWNIAYADRKFYRFNRYYKFSDNEILSILEQTCKLYENVLEESKPDFMIMGLHDSHRNHLLYEMIKFKKIDLLMLGGTRFGYRGKITSDEKSFGIKKKNSMQKERNSKELLDFLTKYDHSKLQVENKQKYLKKMEKNRLRTLAKFFLEGGNTTSQKHFSRYGTTRAKVFRESINFLFKRRKIQSFIEQNTVKEIKNSDRFIYFPLHSEPERALSIAAPYYTNQIEVITNIAKSLPIEFELFVKDHPSMGLKGGGGRKLSFYQDITKLYNVKLLHPKIKRDDILSKCSMVITINGTAGFEAAFFGKPAITFIDTDYSMLPFVHVIKKFEDLPSTIRNTLKETVDFDALNEYVNMINEQSFEYNKAELNSDFYGRFFDRGYVIIEKEINEDEMVSFLEDHKDEYQKLANRFLEKIQEHRETQRGVQR